MKGNYIIISSIAVLAFSLTAACGKKESRLIEIGPLEGEVSIIAWPGYIERGETDKSYDWVTGFEKETGCKLNVKTAATSDEMIALMIEGGYDLVTASGDASLRLVASGKVQEINIDLVPSWKSVDSRLQNAAWHTVEGKHYGIPYQWGPNVLMYNTKIFKKAPSSWTVVFEEQKLPDGKSNKNRIQAFDGPIYIADAALFLKHTKPELGISDPYELDEKQYDAVIELLKKQRQLVPKYWHDAMVQVDDFKKGNLIASSTWPFQVNMLVGEKQPVGSVVPVEGATGWADTTMLHIDSKHVNCAYKWLEHSISLKLQGDLASWFGSVPSVPTACKGNPLLGESGCSVNGFNNFEKISFWRTPVTNCSGGRKCVPYKKWAEDFISIIGSR
ncbi:ABC transporter substrate-binding protein [Leptospira ilyithenensis]|uniref:Extracellular solute-binding protein n=1 Tax=Leptospira ilyithenensis TaxID=2484901 RepID=A0A4R9LQQ9_9LEPT|nr:ABC transporter substrate-binding protein [Leptospira ilyithenensis]TGN10577.1 extracellular solute-binding protein [Leptospira ilyithenensis]